MVLSGIRTRRRSRPPQRLLTRGIDPQLPRASSSFVELRFRFARVGLTSDEVIYKSALHGG